MQATLLNKKVSKSFYKRDLLHVAERLLGKILVKKEGNKLLAGRIIEVEAYDGDTDRAAHSFGGITKRNEVMFDEGGLLYVYLSYGVHYCCNVVTGVKGQGKAILIRAVEPVSGIDKMIKNRFHRKMNNENDKYNLTNGPGKVCNAFGINLKHSGVDLTGENIYVVNGLLKKEEQVGISKRIGITKSAELPWRFFIKDNPYLSRK